jgi:hypothetical protein
VAVVPGSPVLTLPTTIVPARPSAPMVPVDPCGIVKSNIIEKKKVNDNE